MRSIMILALLAGCLSRYTAQPHDLIKPGPGMCNAVNEDLWKCYDATGRPWTCDAISGWWKCQRDL